jgi:hypothetical protein
MVRVVRELPLVSRAGTHHLRELLLMQGDRRSRSSAIVEQERHCLRMLVIAISNRSA